MDKLILKFIKKHHVLTLATVRDNVAHSSNLFYAFDEKNSRVIFTSSEDTKHIKDGVENPFVAVNIVLETKVIGKICGVQANGILGKIDAESEDYKNAKMNYIKRFPYAALMDLIFWSVSFDEIKFTDNKLGFGKKLYWKREK